MNYFSWRIIGLYSLLVLIWLALPAKTISDWLPHPTQEMMLYKSWTLLIITGLLLLALLKRESKRQQGVVAQLRSQQQSLGELTQALSQSPVSVMITNLKGEIEFVNRAFETMSGFQQEEALGANPRIFKSGQTPRETYEAMWQAMQHGEAWDGELLNQRKDGHPYWVHAHISPIQDAQGSVVRFLAIEEDISEQKIARNRVRQDSNYDELTELPNRFLATDRMSHAISNAIRNEQTVALLFIDLDNFRAINTDHGQDAGDNLISLAAMRIQESVRQTDTVARFGGDKFLVIINGLEYFSDISRIAEKIRTALAQPYSYEGQPLGCTASVGIAVYPQDGQDPYELLRHADAAMYAAKDDGGNGCHFHSAQVNSAAKQQVDLEKRLQTAVQAGEFSLCYLPLMDANTGAIMGAEALLRWDNAELGRIAPEQFLPIAEASGLIVPIGHWVLDTACKQLADWSTQGMDRFRLAINLSPRQILDRGLIKQLLNALNKHRLDPTRLQLELTESVLSHNPQEALNVVHKLHNLGIKVGLDNFGTGPASLHNLQRFKLDFVKIDRSFIGEIECDGEATHDPETDHGKSDKALIDATLALAKGLGLSTIGEGVETEAQLRYLRQRGVDNIQGYLYTAPLPPGEFDAFCRQHRPSTPETS